MPQRAAEEAVVGVGAAIRPIAQQVPLATDLARTEVPGVVKRDQPPFSEAFEGLDRAGRRDGLAEQAIERGRRGAIEHKPNVIAGRDFGHAEQGSAVRPALPGGNSGLTGQRGGAAQEADRERGKPDIAHRTGVWTERPFTRVGQTGAGLA